MYNYSQGIKGTAMSSDFEMLADILKLSPYQSRTLAAGKNRYDIGRLAVRGGILFAPVAPRGIFSRATKMLLGARVDIIGRDQIISRDQRIRY